MHKIRTKRLQDYADMQLTHWVLLLLYALPIAVMDAGVNSI